MCHLHWLMFTKPDNFRPSYITNVKLIIKVMGFSPTVNRIKKLWHLFSCPIANLITQ